MTYERTDAGRGTLISNNSYACWLQYKKIANVAYEKKVKLFLETVVAAESSTVMETALEELQAAVSKMTGVHLEKSAEPPANHGIVLSTAAHFHQEEIIGRHVLAGLGADGYVIRSLATDRKKLLYLVGKTDKGVLYAVFHLLRLLQTEQPLEQVNIVENPRNPLRMINQWDNLDGTIERGYAGKSIFFENNKITANITRIKDYARLLSSVGINAISINNVNVFEAATKLITKQLLPDVAAVADIFRAYGITLFLSINYASPIQLGTLPTADPLDERVQQWWKEKASEIYRYIPDFGGFLVKADSEHRPGPFTYGRDHAEGANVLAEALKPYGGVVIWRCFVYNCLQDWRDRSTDRAKAAYDNFKPLDGEFLDNVILQVKNGPMDFQVREPVSPLLGAMKQTNQVLEFQIAQEYTGQQIDLCYLVPQWKEVLDFDTYAKGEGTTVKSIVSGSVYGFSHSGIAAVSNIGNDVNWTGNTLAQANLYGYGRLIWNPELAAEEIAEEWIVSTFGNEPLVTAMIREMLMESWSIYENYTAPLGIGWMVNPGHHYGPNVDGYEYAVWGTYHFADCHGIGVDRTTGSGTGYVSQYFSPNKEMYESLENCPEELLLFFHHVPYTHTLKSGETVIQHIYNTHFKGAAQVAWLIDKWRELEGKIDQERYENVLDRLQRQLKNAVEWRDIINTYFYRKSGIADEQNRTIY
ncbi:alpha-glucuronidase [Evansella caseinilytica]|uniref:Xylan alpha-1,2-glucuronidase n=1 Tax=Evansella caseinilytica TaxID=1503961 RepID=A0A1H3UDJ8_9BACI|nr:alpha-glucuronidase family glycosyl hydrolase [Evansella caseinilytica]SDZ60513.1 alpha-glucuronidase [Evansella caseinilytica]